MKPVQTVSGTKTLLKLSAGSAAVLGMSLALPMTAQASCVHTTYCDMGSHVAVSATPSTGTSTLPPLTSYFDHQRSAHAGGSSASAYASANALTGASARASAYSGLRGLSGSASASAAAKAYASGTANAAARSSAQSSAQSSAAASAAANASARASATSRASGSSAYAGAQSSARASSYGSGARASAAASSSAYAGSTTYRTFSGSTASASGLRYGESLRATTCPSGVHTDHYGRILGCYNVVRPVPQTHYYRVVRPIIYVRYPVPVAVPYPVCHSRKANHIHGPYCGQRDAKPKHRRYSRY